MAKEDQDGKIRDWADTCGSEVKAWVASVIWWCLCKTLTFHQFYLNNIDPTLCKKWFPSWRRWTGIKRFLKLSDPFKDPLNKHNRLFKVEELFTHFVTACKANYWPSACVALDEAVKKFKGRCIFKQYIKNKPVKWGIKIFCVCCSRTSYLWNASFYVGKREENDGNVSATHDTVMKLLRPLEGKNHEVYMDNYYTGIPLLVELQKKMSIYGTGTVRTNRRGLDKQVTMKKSEEKQLKKEPGITRFSSWGNIVYASWFDKRPVHVLSTCHPPIGNDTVQHWFPARRGEKPTTASGKVLKEIPICPIVRNYRLNMGAVDTFDQYRAYIRLEMRTSKFWHVMMWFIVESALVNSFILYKITRENANIPVELSHLEFRIAVVRALASEWEAMGCACQPAGVSSPNSMLKRTNAKKARVSFGKESSGRFSANDCHLSNLEDIPKREGQKTKTRQLVCIYEGCKGRRTTKWCRACAAPLCFPECFRAYHTPCNDL